MAYRASSVSDDHRKSKTQGVDDRRISINHSADEHRVSKIQSQPTASRSRTSRVSCVSKHKNFFRRESSTYSQGALNRDQFDYHGHRIDKAKMENTYRMAPEPEETFQPYLAKAFMETILLAALENKKYDEELSRELCLKLANTIKDRAQHRHTLSKRYRYIALVTIGQNTRQGMQISSRCLWDKKTDNFASATYSNSDLFAVALLHAVYLE